MEQDTHEGTIVLITGAGSGIGRELALAYGRAGALALICDRNEITLEETAALLDQEGLDSGSFVADVSRPEEVIRMFADIEELFGRVDTVVNNAGYGIWKSPYDLEVDEWDHVIDTNLRGAFLCSREGAKLMRKDGVGGSIVQIASTRALMSEPNTEAYAASKGGLLALTHALAASLGPDRIKVNAILPGWIETGDYSKLGAADHEQHPAGRVGRPDDIARACLYLTDPRNSFVTGSQLTIDGGMTTKMIYVE
ncbi:SDR family NAD(P)-dependent oxidoreductase [Paenibacillus sp. strain BS8-2]